MLKTIIVIIVYLGIPSRSRGEKTYDVDPIATTLQGQLRGGFGESRNGRDYLKFLAVPYAQFTETFKV